MRVLHVFDHSIPLQSGYSFRSISILEQQRARGWETVQMTSPKHVLPFSPEEDIEGWHFYRTAAPNPLSQKVPAIAQWAQMAATTRRLREVAKAVKPDLLHPHSPVLNAIPALRVGRALNIPVVYEVRGLWEDAAVSHGTGRHGSLRYHLSRALETYAIKRADAVTVICEGLREDLLARDIAAGKITVIPNAVDAALFRLPPRDPELAARLGLSGQDVLGFLGSFYSYEGLHLLLEAMPSILSARPGTRLLLVGGGPENARLKELSARLGLNDVVVFTGRIPHEQIQRYYALVDVLIYPRIAMRLTEKVTPLKPLEAMALGKVVIASDVGGHRELIRDGMTGNLFRANDRDDLVRTVLRVLDNRLDWPRQVEAGHHFVEHERTWRLSVARYEPVYQRLVDCRTSSNRAI